MGIVTFIPSEADTLAAQRAFMRRYVFSSSRLLKVFLPICLMISSVIAGALLGILVALHIHVGDREIAVILLAAICAGLWLVALFIWLTFAGLPRLVKRNYAQQAMLRVEYTVSWSDDGIVINTLRGTMSHLWGDFFSWAEGPETVMLFQSDHMFNFIPKSACSPPDLDDLRRTMAAAGVKRA